MINIMDALIDTLLFIEIVNRTGETRIDKVLNKVNEIKRASAIGAAAASGASEQKRASSIQNKREQECCSLLQPRR